MATGYGKGRATGYSDFYKRNSSGYNQQDTEETEPTPEEIKERRRAALKRRLQMRKVGS